VNDANEIAPVELLAVAGHVDEEHQQDRPQNDEPDPAARHTRTGPAARLAGGRRCLAWGHGESSTNSCGGLFRVRRGAIPAGERSLKIANAVKPDYGDTSRRKPCRRRGADASICHGFRYSRGGKNGGQRCTSSTTHGLVVISATTPGRFSSAT